MLSSYALDMQLLPTMATKCMQELYQVFPGEQAYLERQELLMMKYYFGAHVKNISTYVNADYPRSIYELMDAKENDTLLLRLAYLADRIAWCFRDEKNESNYKTRFANLFKTMHN